MFEYVLVEWNWTQCGIFETFEEAEEFRLKRFRPDELVIIIRRKNDDQGS